MNIFNHKELERRLGGTIRSNQPYPKQHQTFLQKLTAHVEWLLESYKKNPEETINQIK